MASSDNFIRLKKAERNRSVYRVISIECLYELFETKENVVVSPRKWGDPEINFKYRGREVSRGWFGQCWTHNSASDAIWSIYSKDWTGVRIRSTPYKLVKLAEVSLGSGWDVFVGKVLYPSRERLKQCAKSALGELNGSVNIAKTLLIKRGAFRHEAEVRLLMFRKGLIAPDGVERYKVDVAEMIDQIRLDPRLPTCCANRLKKEICERTEFKGKIDHSQLYSPRTICLD